MANLSGTQIEQLWIEEGGPADVAPVMAAIALQQSSGNPAAGYVTSKESSHGLWQINTDPNANPEFAGLDLQDPRVNARAAVQLYKKDGFGPWQWVPQNSNDPYGPAVENPILTAWNGAGGAKGGQQAAKAAYDAAGYAASTPAEGTVSHVARAAAGPHTPTATLDAQVTGSDATAMSGIGPTGQLQPVTGGTGSALLPGVTEQPPLPNVDPGNFHGFDLRAIPANMLGNAERAVQEYITNPGYAQKIKTTIQNDFGYSGGWIEKLPEVYGVLVWASSNLDPSTAAGQNLFLGAISNTNWWKTTDQNKRAWDEEVAQDPATAATDIRQARDHVIATANQVGVQLTKAQVEAIANVYAAQAFTQSGVLGSQSGTSQDWLDQAVVDTALNIKATGAVTGNVTGAGAKPLINQDYAGGVTDLTGNTSPENLSGIAAELYTKLQQTAQQYMLYDPANPSHGVLNEGDLMNYVRDALRHYTGSGSFSSSNLIQGASAEFNTQMMNLAKRYYPTISGAIDQGIAPSTYFAPIQNQISQALYGTVDYAHEINLLSPQWNWAIATPNAKGEKTVLTPDQIQRKLVTTPEYQKSPVAVTNARNFAQTLVSGLGLGA